MSKKLEEKRLRREAEERKQAKARRSRRRRNLVTFAIAGAVAALVVFLIFSERTEEQAVDGVTAGEAGCTDIEEPEELGADHVDEGTPVNYNSTPPTSGPHYQQTANVGFSEEPIRPEQLVHNMEHGQVVVWFSPDAAQSTVDSLTAYVENAGIAMVGTPFGEVPDGKAFSITAWGALQSCDEVSEGILDRFRSRYQGRGPEQVGIPVFEE